MKACILFMIAICLAGVARAADKIDVCAWERTSQGDGKHYGVQATTLMGMELNERTKSFNYDGLSRYVVIFWSEHQASIIKLENAFPVSFFPVNGVDQAGRAWAVELSSGFCM